MEQTRESYTEFAPVERASDLVLRQQVEYLSALPLLGQLLDAVPMMVLILNRQRQAVYANLFSSRQLGISDKQTIFGLRLGEILNCIHAYKYPGGCGSTRFCALCGAVRAILISQEGQVSEEECRVLRDSNGQVEALDLRVVSTPFETMGQAFTIYAVEDLSAEKRRRALERIFFHDVLNTAGIIQSAIELVSDGETDEVEILEQMIFDASRQLVEEIQAQKDLVAAENNELVPRLAQARSLDLLQQVANLHTNFAAARERHIRISDGADDVTFVSDSTLLKRVLGNMVKNALEASKPGQVVTLGSRVENKEVEFWVHNADPMPKNVQMQVFQRSFSTKGDGRGLGTYSMKLLSERYLAGRVSFTSSEEEGTTFRASYPLHLVLRD
jgi:signal transduction histidine kinase